MKPQNKIGNLNNQAAFYLGLDLTSPLTRNDLRKLRAKKKKIRTSTKKALRSNPLRYTNI